MIGQVAMQFANSQPARNFHVSKSFIAHPSRKEFGILKMATTISQQVSFITRLSP
jgi:hypothetical protein